MPDSRKSRRKTRQADPPGGSTRRTEDLGSDGYVLGEWLSVNTITIGDASAVRLAGGGNLRTAHESCFWIILSHFFGRNCELASTQFRGTFRESVSLIVQAVALGRLLLRLTFLILCQLRLIAFLPKTFFVPKTRVRIKKIHHKLVVYPHYCRVLNCC